MYDVRAFDGAATAGEAAKQALRSPPRGAGTTAALGDRERTGGIALEVALLLREARAVWALIPLRHKLGLGGASLMMASASACSTAIPLLVGQLIDGIQRAAGGRRQSLAFLGVAGPYLALIGCAFLVREGLNVARRYLVEQSSTHIHRSLTLQAMRHLLRMDLAALANDKVGALHGRVSRSVEGAVRFVRLGALDFFPALLTGALALSAAVWKQPVLGAVMAGVIPISLFLTARQLSSQKGIRLRLMRFCEEVDGTIVEQLGGIEYIRAAHTEKLEARRLDRIVRRRRSLEVRHHLDMSLFGGAKAINEGFFHILVLACAVYLAAKGAISFGSILALSWLFLGVMAPLNEVHRVIDEGHECALRVRDLLQILHEPADRSYEIASPRRPRLTVGEPAVVVRDIRVSYVAPSGKTVHALSGMSFEIRHGETIGVAGCSGAGKSTFVKVLLKLVHPDGGDVLVGGARLADVTRADLARLVGYVGQQPFVFAGTIAENISYGKKDASLDEIREVAIQANLHDEILWMPDGYQTRVSERGRNLSGGQCQRLALARTLLLRPPILVLDEATSAVDNIGERHLQLALGLRRADRTMILVAHRLSTLRPADRILVFDRGRLAETGTYDDLVEAGGVFTSLVQSARD